MLERFFAYGPESPGRVLDKVEWTQNPELAPDQKIATRVLDVHFHDNGISFPPYPQYLQYNKAEWFNRCEERERWKCEHCGLNCHYNIVYYKRYLLPILYSGQLFIWFMLEIYDLLTKQHSLYWSEILYRGVGTLRLRLRGDSEVDFELNLGQLLAGMPLGDDKKNEAIQKIEVARKNFGLECFERTPFANHAEWRESVVSRLDEICLDVMMCSRNDIDAHR